MDVRIDKSWQDKLGLRIRRGIYRSDEPPIHDNFCGKYPSPDDVNDLAGEADEGLWHI